MVSSAAALSPAKFTIFRAADAPDLDELGIVDTDSFSQTVLEGIGKVVEAGINEGQTVRVLFSVPGFSLVYAWFKSSFPLPLHSHDADCLYYVVSGSLKLGTEKLGAGEGFFVPAGVPYTYRAGAEGVEVLEFRHEQQFDMKVKSANAAFWNKAVETVKSELPIWRRLPQPAALAGLASETMK